MLATLAVAGCGGDDGPRLTSREYATKADAICSKFQQDQRAVGEVSDVRGIAEAVDRLLPTFDDAVDELESLRPPKSREDDADSWLDSMDALRSDLVKLRDRARENDAEGVREVAGEAAAHNETSNRLAARLGLEACSTG